VTLPPIRSPAPVTLSIIVVRHLSLGKVVGSI